MLSRARRLWGAWHSLQEGILTVPKPSVVPMSEMSKTEWLSALVKYSDLESLQIVHMSKSGLPEFAELNQDLASEVEELFNKEVRPREPFTLEDGKYAVSAALTHDNELVGAIATEPLIGENCVRTAPHLDLNFIAVNPSMQGRGLASSLIGQNMVAILKTVPLDFIYGNCTEASAGFYDRLGFSVSPPGGAVPSSLIATENRRSQQPDFPIMFWRRFD